MPTRGRHQSTSKECRRLIERVESIPGVKGVIIGHSFGGKSLGRHQTTGSLKLQRTTENGFKGVIQTAKGVQELFILVHPGEENHVRSQLEAITDSP